MKSRGQELMMIGLKLSLALQDSLNFEAKNPDFF